MNYKYLMLIAVLSVVGCGKPQQKKPPSITVNKATNVDKNLVESPLISTSPITPLFNIKEDYEIHFKESKIDVHKKDIEKIDLSEPNR